MSYSIFSHDDIKQMKAIRITEEQVISQIKLFKKKPSYLKLNRPCTIGDGIRVIPEDEIKELILHHQEAASRGRLLKFVPASGAASRMFKSLLNFNNLNHEIDRDYITRKAGEDTEQAEDILSFMDGIRKFAFFDDLKSSMSASGLDIDTQIGKGQFKEIVHCLLTSQGLNYADLPKGLLKFHQYSNGSRTAFEEHLVEAADYVKDAQNVCRLHFTVSPEHQESFKGLMKDVRNEYEKKYNARFQADFSLQKRSTDTIAVDMGNQPFREKDGKLLFRPGGHGALIENLNDLKGDIIYIKNIDNVATDRIKCPTFLWKKILAGFLIELQKKIFTYLKRLVAQKHDEQFLDEVTDFAIERLCLTPPNGWKRKSIKEKREFLLNKLNRPLRVCGMVKNEGEPGGGPFWVEGKDGALSMQIVESAQVDPKSNEQQAIFASGTHFNPVDIVCGVRDYKGDPFDLWNYIDADAVFISQKSKDGRNLKALELPGLWNGAMANWITLFVEVPIITFNPIKTINDLLRKEHQPQ
ncbi:MAG: DUF4301 family protein [Desulfobacterales bacterium]|nr:DUF4301 family protein [Desulfobacterales bacterium]